MSELISAIRHDAVLEIRICRPEKKNALTPSMYDAMTAQLRAAESDPAVRVMLITGQPGIFTAGNDLADFMNTPLVDENNPVFRFLFALVECEKPLVAGVDGAAVGIGTTMLLHCDYVVASTRARFSLPFVNLGLVPEGASSVLLPARVGIAIAQKWLLSGEPFAAEEAHSAGLIAQLSSPESLAADALAVAQKLAGKPPIALRQTKELLRGWQREIVKNAIRAEGKYFVERLQSDEARQAFMAFFARKS